MVRSNVGEPLRAVILQKIIVLDTFLLVSLGVKKAWEVLISNNLRRERCLNILKKLLTRTNLRGKGTMETGTVKKSIEVN